MQDGTPAPRVALRIGVMYIFAALPNRLFRRPLSSFGERRPRLD